MISGLTLVTSMGVTVKNAIILDFETRSGADLTKVGVANYLANPDYHLLCMVARLPDGRYIQLIGAGTGLEPAADREALLAAVQADHPLAAHNAEGFDRHVWEHAKLPAPPGGWIDTLPLCRRAGLPGSLDQIAKALYGQGKDEAGRKLTIGLSRYDRHGKLPRLTIDLLRRVAVYCRRDVELLARIWDEGHCGAPVPAIEHEVLRLDGEINWRGVCLDAKLARALILMCDRMAAQARDHVPEDRRRLINSPVKLRRWLNDEGFQVSDVGADTIESLLDDENLPDHVRDVLLARTAAAPNTAKRLRGALLRVDPDGRLHNMFAYHAAHTGRWSGRGFQPQNLPRGVKIADLNAAVDAAMRLDLDALAKMAPEDAGVEDVLATLVRQCLCAPDGQVLVAVDFASIEARGLSWLADDLADLDRFRQGLDPYKVMAAKIYGQPYEQISKKQRGVGKIPVLACGYGMGPQGLEVYAEPSGVDFREANTSAEAVVDAWRDAHLRVAGERTGEFHEGRPCRTGGLWKDVEAAAIRAVRDGGQQYAGRCVWEMCGTSLRCLLPSGRSLFYRDVRIVDRSTPWGESRPALEYAFRSGRTTTYGGKLVENVVQAVCRDILVDLMVRATASGLLIAMHVHDELVVQVDAAKGEETLALLEGLARTSPTWAPDFPIEGSGYCATRYRKD